MLEMFPFKISDKQKKFFVHMTTVAAKKKKKIFI